VTRLDHRLLRTLAGWSPEGVPVTSLYLTVDGRRYPRRADLEVRVEELARHARAQAAGLTPDPRRSVEADLERMASFIRDDLDRRDTRGVALFSAADGALWEEILLSRPVRDRAFVAPRAELRMLEVLLETHGVTCTAVTDYEKARIFLLQLGRIEEVHDLWDEVPGRHDQGGRSQLRRQRHVDDHRRQHLKHVADALFGLWKSRGFEHLVLAGPGEAHRELEQELHGYLRERVRANVTLPVTAAATEVRARTQEVEESLELASEHRAIERLAALETSGGAVLGLEPTLAALADERVDTLVVRIDLEAPGRRCHACGRLSTRGPCPACGGPTQELTDVVEVAVATAYGRGCRVETIAQADGLTELGGVGALLRY
jgi:peptide chain release factor subunit 1